MASTELFRVAVQECLEEDYNVSRQTAQSLCFAASNRLDVLCETTPLVLVEEAAEELYSHPNSERYWRMAR